MNKVVSNATPLIYLAKVDKLNLLKSVFSNVFIPEEVKREVVDEGKRLKNILLSSMGLKEKRPEKSFTGLPSLKL